MGARTNQNLVGGAVLTCAACLFATAGGCGQVATSRPEATALATAAPAAPPQGLHTTTIHRPYAQLGIVTPADDGRGKPARVPCLTCHNDIRAKERNRGAKSLKDFHQEVRLKHGNHTCQTCHTVPGFDTFHLADGTIVPYENVMQLCGQCHATRLQEYEKGAHGGMSGYWDLKRGPRVRNHCLDCHNAHAPAVPKVVPAPRQRYRTGL